MFQSLRTALLTVVTLSLLAACSSSPRIESFQDYNPAMNFEGYRSWSFISEHPMVVASTNRPMNPLLEGRIMDAIRQQMTAKGFTYVNDPEAADFVVSFTVGSREQIKVTEYPASYQMSYGRYYRHSGWGMTYGTGTETRVRQYTEGQLAVDIFDVASRSPAFHGGARTRLTESDRENPQPLIRSIVGEALSGFPPGRDGSNAEPLLVPLIEAG